MPEPSPIPNARRKVSCQPYHDTLRRLISKRVAQGGRILGAAILRRLLARRQGLKPANRALEECSRGVIVAVRAELQCDRVHDGAGSLVRCLERARLLDNGVELSDATQRR